MHFWVTLLYWEGPKNIFKLVRENWPSMDGDPLLEGRELDKSVWVEAMSLKRLKMNKDKSLKAGVVFVAAIAGWAGLASVKAEQLHFTYLWHLEQPIYWPDQRPWGDDRYEVAWESIQRTDGGASHPQNNLRDIFGLDDRKAAYQYRCRDCINAIRGYDEAGAQISYSGGLIENVFSLGNAGQLGYSWDWYGSLREARGWTTVGQSKPRCDHSCFPFSSSAIAIVRRERGAQRNPALQGHIQQCLGQLTDDIKGIVSS